MRILPLILASSLALAGLASCHIGLAYRDRSPRYRISPGDYEQFQELRRQLATAGYQRKYRWRQLYFTAVDTKNGYGLYHAVMPSKRKRFNVVIPCIIGFKGSLANSCYINDKATCDTRKTSIILDSILTGLKQDYGDSGNHFTIAEINSIKNNFTRGAYAELKPGQTIEFR